ncbi:TRAP transporter small permease [Xylophilus sp. GW821-FHT01B05]
MHALARLHDAVTRLGFGLAGLALVVIVLSFCFEVVSRYALSAPTEWASPTVSYAMAIMIFLAFPELSRQSAHIAINIVTDEVSPPARRVLLSALRVAAAVTCLLATWFSFNETWSQYQQDVWTNPPLAVPKWTVSLFIPYGMLSSALYFLRQVTGREEGHACAAGSVA